MIPAVGYIKLTRATLRDTIMDDPNGFILLMQAALKAWRGPGISQGGLYPGEAILTRPRRMSDKEFRAAKIRLVTKGLLAIDAVRRKHTIACLTEAGERLADPQVLWGELRGDYPSATKPARAGNFGHRTSLRGEPRGEVKGSRANRLADKDEVWGESRGELPLVERSKPASTCEADQDSRGELRGEVEGEVPSEKGRTLNKKEDKNKDSSSWSGLLETLWAEVAPRRNADKPPKTLFQRKCTELLVEHSETTIRALIGYANVKADRSFIGHIEWAIKNGKIPDALDYLHAELDRKRKAAEPSQPPPSQEEITEMDRRNSLFASLVLARNRNDQAEVERLKAILDFNPQQLGQPTPCAHGALSGAGQGLCPSEPREGEGKEPKA